MLAPRCCCRNSGYVGVEANDVICEHVATNDLGMCSFAEGSGSGEVGGEGARGEEEEGKERREGGAGEITKKKEEEDEDEEKEEEIIEERKGGKYCYHKNSTEKGILTVELNEPVRAFGLLIEFCSR